MRSTERSRDTLSTNPGSRDPGLLRASASDEGVWSHLKSQELKAHQATNKEELTKKDHEALKRMETEFVSFDPPRVVRVLERIAADLANLGLVPNDPQARHRRELAEPPREPKKLSHREQRTALRAELGLPRE